MRQHDKRSEAMPSMWGVDLCPSESQTRQLDAVSCDAGLNLELPMDMGEYHITRLIGRGGMGVVLEGEHRRMQRRVAIKVLHASQSEIGFAQEQFLSEIRAVARLLHPRIVTAFDAGQHESIVYLVMEYVDGATLFQLVHSQGPCTVNQALRLIRQSAEGLAHAHLNSVIHRDVKPGNMMVTRDGSLKLLDLGLAAFAQSSQRDNPNAKKISGTPEYMPPEQFQGLKLGESVDVYALGCTLIFLLTGSAPYAGKSVSALMRAHATAPIPRLQGLSVAAPAGLQDLIDRMLAKRVEDRYASMEQVIDAIDAIASESSPSATSPVPSIASRDLSTEATVDLSPTRLGVDLGGRYMAVATLDDQGQPKPLRSGTGGQSLAAHKRRDIRKEMVWYSGRQR